MSEFRRLLMTRTPVTPTVREFKWTLATTSANKSYSFTIKNNVSDYYVDWGDGSTVQTGATSHTFVQAGTYQVRVYETDTTTTFPLVSMARSSDTYLETSIDTPIPYIDNTTDFSGLYRYSAGLLTVCAGLFDNNPQLTSLQECFCFCRSLLSLPDFFFRNLPACYNFVQTLRGTRALKLNANLFCDEATEKTTRFANYSTQVSFDNFIYRISQQASSTNGVAPELWNYTYGAGVYSKQCFRGNGGNVSGVPIITNWSSIPSSWIN